jgi:small-conductance mechanosensitive channel
MNMTPYLIIAGIICIIALVLTIAIGMNPRDDNYNNAAKTKKHFINLTLIYAVVFVPAILMIFVYFIIR